MTRLNNDILVEKMVEYYTGDPKRIQHFLKVYTFAAMIGRGENLDADEQMILETAAITHDIGIKISEEKYQSSSGKYQEKEGPAIARELLSKLGYEEHVIARVEYLIAHHHTYKDITEIDYQILVEADFLVNMYEDELPVENIKKVYEKIFKTQTGSALCREIFAV